MSVRSTIEKALERGAGILRLAPTWVPRSFCVPGRRIKLHPADYYSFGGTGEASTRGGFRRPPRPTTDRRRARTKASASSCSRTAPARRPSRSVTRSASSRARLSGIASGTPTSDGPCTRSFSTTRAPCLTTCITGTTTRAWWVSWGSPSRTISRSRTTTMEPIILTPFSG